MLFSSHIKVCVCKFNDELLTVGANCSESTFKSSGDVEIPIIVDSSNVSWLQRPIVVERLQGGLPHLDVTHENVTSVHQHLQLKQQAVVYSL